MRKILLIIGIILLLAIPCWSKELVVAVDVGHTLEHPGVISARGIPELGYNMVMGAELISALKEHGYRNVFISSEPDLKKRAEIFNNSDADLLISIHHDSVQPKYLSEWIVGDTVQHYSDVFSGYSVFYSNKNGQALDSRRFASSVGMQMRKMGFKPTLHHSENIPGENRMLISRKIGLYRFDDLILLKYSKKPAILLECGIIVNRQDELEIQDPYIRERIINAIISAINKMKER